MNRTIAPMELNEMLEKCQNVTILDVRRKADYQADPGMIPNAIWKDPEQINQWSHEVPQDTPVVIYCVRGGSVSNSVLDHLIQKNLNARYIEGGIMAWKDFRARTIARGGAPGGS